MNHPTTTQDSPASLPVPPLDRHPDAAWFLTGGARGRADGEAAVVPVMELVPGAPRQGPWRRETTGPSAARPHVAGPLQRGAVVPTLLVRQLHLGLGEGQQHLALQLPRLPSGPAGGAAGSPRPWDYSEKLCVDRMTDRNYGRSMVY